MGIRSGIGLYNMIIFIRANVFFIVDSRRLDGQF